MADKPKLKMITKSVFDVDYGDFEEFVIECYPQIKDYSFVDTQECGNDSTHEFEAENTPLEGYDLADWEKTLRTGRVPEYRNSLLFNKLCIDGFIEPGIYIIGVCW